MSAPRMQGTHTVRSNRESGYGRYDVMLTPKDPARQAGLVVEFKNLRKKETPRKRAHKSKRKIRFGIADSELHVHHSLGHRISWKRSVYDCSKADLEKQAGECACRRRKEKKSQLQTQLIFKGDRAHCHQFALLTLRGISKTKVTASSCATL